MPPQTTRQYIPLSQRNGVPTQYSGGSGSIDDIMKGLSHVESGGRYDALGKVSPTTGDRAYGKYQAMGQYIPGWTKQYLGRELTPEQYLADPKAQEDMMRARATELYNKYGNADDVASVHFTGRPVAKAGLDVADYTGTTNEAYLNKFREGMGQAGSSLKKYIPLAERGAQNLVAQGEQIFSDTVKKYTPIAERSRLAEVPAMTMKGLDIIGETIDNLYGLPGRILTGNNPNVPTGFSQQVQGASDALGLHPYVGAGLGLAAGIAEPAGLPGKASTVVKIAKETTEEVPKLFPKISPKLQAVQDRFNSHADFVDPAKTPLKDGRYAILTAENPGAEVLSAAENAVRNEKLFKELVDAGYSPIKVVGRYGSTPENSFIVPGLSPARARKIGDDFGQETVLTKEGLIYKDGTVNPADTSTINFDGDQTDFFTEAVIDGKKVKFSIPINFDTQVPMSDLVKMPSESELNKILTVDAPAAKLHIDNVIDDISTKVQDLLVGKAPLKSTQSLLRKLRDEKNGVLSSVHDIARNTLVAKTPIAMGQALDALQTVPGYVTHKLQTGLDFAGYEGNLVKVRAPNGHVAEIQVTTPEMYYGKMPGREVNSKQVLGEELWNAIKQRTGVEPGVGHSIYEDMRVLDLYHPEDYNKWQDLLEQSMEYYSRLK